MWEGDRIQFFRYSTVLGDKAAFLDLEDLVDSSSFGTGDLAREQLRLHFENEASSSAESLIVADLLDFRRERGDDVGGFADGGGSAS